MVEDRNMERWFALEMTALSRSFVTQTRPLGDLLAEAAPEARTQSGEPHRFDTQALRRAAEVSGPLARRRLRLPVTFYVEKETPEDAHVADEAAIELLRALGEVPADAGPREGKLWLGHSRARLVAQRYPTLFQFVYR